VYFDESVVWGQYSFQARDKPAVQFIQPFDW